VWVDYYAGTDTLQAAWFERHLDIDRLGLTDLIMCEVLQGIRGHSKFAEIHEDLSRFEIFSGVGQQIAVASAENYRILRARGITTRKTIDCLIATFCIQKGYSLLHNDRDYEPFEKYLGLSVIHP
jgi:predicted nucleic acid-binding protein